MVPTARCATRSRPSTVTGGGGRIVTRQAQTAALIGAGYELVEVAVVLGVDIRTVRRDARLLGGLLLSDAPVVRELAA
jgi:hypothetical protein